jgi:hypothetical protein
LLWPIQSQAADVPTAFPAVNNLPVRAVMPDPLITDGGKTISTPEQWQLRREPMKPIIEHSAIGHAPPPPGNVTGHELKSKMLAGGVTYRLIHLTFGPREKLGLDISIFLPAETNGIKAPFPTIVQPAFFSILENPPPVTNAVAVGTNSASAKKLVDEQVAQLNQREENLKKELAELQSGRAEIASAVDETARARYERLLKSKGDNVIVGVHNGVCGGCHMKLPAQILITCQGHKELISCINCGRILYYTRDMILAGAE